MKLFLIRHGEVEAAYHQRFGGVIDMNLSPLGHEQADATAEWFRDKGLHAIYCSPMKRAQLTVEPLAKVTGLEPQTMDDLREVDFGVWTGLHWNEIPEKFQTTAFDWLDKLHDGGIEEAETAQQLSDRIEPCLNEIIARHEGENVGIVCHGGVIRILMALLLYVPIPRTAAFEIDYASVTQILYRPPHTKAEFVNHTPWKKH